MKIQRRTLWWIFVAIAVGAVGGWAQHSMPSPEPGQTLKIEGEVTRVLAASGSCTPTFALKTAEGKQYIVHLGPLWNSEGKVFNPKVGERITVTGTPCCEMNGKTMIHSKEVLAEGKTFSPRPGTPSEGMMCQGNMPCCGAQSSGTGCLHCEHK